MVALRISELVVWPLNVSVNVPPGPLTVTDLHFGPAGRPAPGALDVEVAGVDERLAGVRCYCSQRQGCRVPNFVRLAAGTGGRIRILYIAGDGHLRRRIQRRGVYSGLESDTASSTCCSRSHFRGRRGAVDARAVERQRLGVHAVMPPCTCRVAPA